MSNFTDVAHLNDLIGNIKGDLTAPDWVAIERQFALIKEEFEELERAIQERNLTELRDGTADVLVTTYGLAHRAGFDADADMAEVHRSNMSKFCANIEEAIHTAVKYEKLGIRSNYKHHDTCIAVVSAANQIGTDSKSYPKGKLLKSVNFKEPVFK